jgi:hypothetical protein
LRTNATPVKSQTSRDDVCASHPEINIELIRRIWREADERMKREDPEKFRQLQEMQERNRQKSGSSQL